MPRARHPLPDDGGERTTRGPLREPGVDGALTRLAERLRRLRLERGLRLADLGAISGISEAHLSRIEAAERWPSLPALLTLANAYGVDAATLLKETAPQGKDTVHGAGALWLGEEESGAGTMASPGIQVGYDLESRLTDSSERAGADRLSSPEELIGMALAGCFSMSLAQSLAAAGFTPNRIATEAEVTLRSGADEVAITGIHLRCSADVDGVPPARFEEIAHVTKRSCVVSRALAAVPVTLDAELTSGDSPKDAGSAAAANAAASWFPPSPPP